MRLLTATKPWSSDRELATDTVWTRRQINQLQNIKTNLITFQLLSAKAQTFLLLRITQIKRGRDENIYMYRSSLRPYKS